MKPVLERYQQFTNNEFIPSLLWNKDYELSGFSKNLMDKLSGGNFKKIIFSGMGCSAIVSDLVCAFLKDQQINIETDVINDFQIEHILGENVTYEHTLFIINSYSGHSHEPILLYEYLKPKTNNIIFVTSKVSKGKLEKIGRNVGIPLILWELRNPDPEFPLFHVPQFFSILLDAFHSIGLLRTNFEPDLKATVTFLQPMMSDSLAQNTRVLAQELYDHDVILIASARWYFSLLKLAKMHLNEIGRAPAHRDLLHEFSHSEICVCTDPKSSQCVLVFHDDSEHPYTNWKIENLTELLTESISENKHNLVRSVPMQGHTYLEKFFSTLLFIQHMVIELAGHYRTDSKRILISKASGNDWYHK